MKLFFYVKLTKRIVNFGINVSIQKLFLSISKSYMFLRYSLHPPRLSSIHIYVCAYSRRQCSSKSARYKRKQEITWQLLDSAQVSPIYSLELIRALTTPWVVWILCPVCELLLNDESFWISLSHTLPQKVS